METTTGSCSVCRECVGRVGRPASGRCGSRGGMAVLERLLALRVGSLNRPRKERISVEALAWQAESESLQRVIGAASPYPQLSSSENRQDGQAAPVSVGGAR